MKRRLALLAAACAALAVQAQLLEYLHPAEVKPKEKAARATGALRVSGDYMSANRTTGELLATGNVTATAAPFRFLSQRVARTADGVYSFGDDAFTTSCTNAPGDLHWGLRGDFTYIQDEAILAKDVWLYHWGMPVFCPQRSVSPRAKPFFVR